MRMLILLLCTFSFMENGFSQMPREEFNIRTRLQAVGNSVADETKALQAARNSLTWL